MMYSVAASEIDFSEGFKIFIAIIIVKNEFSLVSWSCKDILQGMYVIYMHV